MCDDNILFIDIRSLTIRMAFVVVLSRSTVGLSSGRDLGLRALYSLSEGCLILADVVLPFIRLVLQSIVIFIFWTS